MPINKKLHKQLGLTREKVTGSFIEDVPSVAGLRCARGIPFVKPIEARQKSELVMNDEYFAATMRGVYTFVVRNESGSERMTFELRIIEKGLPMSYGKWHSTDRPLKDIIGDVIEKLVPEVRGPEPWRNCKCYPSKAKRRKA